MAMRARSLRSWAQDYSIEVLPSPQARDKESAQRRESKFNLRRSSSSRGSSIKGGGAGAKTESKEESLVTQFCVGDAVETRQGLTRWQPAKVQRVNADGKVYDIRLDSGDVQFAVAADMLRRPCSSQDKTETLIQALSTCARKHFADFTDTEQRAILAHLSHLGAAVFKDRKPKLKKPPPPPPGPPPAGNVKKDRPPPQGRPKVLGKPPPARKPQIEPNDNEREESGKRQSFTVRKSDVDSGAWLQLEICLSSCVAAAIPNLPLHLVDGVTSKSSVKILRDISVPASWQILVPKQTSSKSNLFHLRAGHTRGPIIARGETDPGRAECEFDLPSAHIICAEIDIDKLRVFSRTMSRAGVHVTYCRLFDDCCRQSMRQAGVVVIVLSALSESDMHLSQQVDFALREFPAKVHVWVEESAPPCALTTKLKASLSDERFESVNAPAGPFALPLACDSLQSLDDDLLLLVLPSVEVPASFQHRDIGVLLRQGEIARRKWQQDQEQEENKEKLPCTVALLQKKAPFSPCRASWIRQVDPRAFVETVLPAQRLLLDLLQSIAREDTAQKWSHKRTPQRCSWPGSQHLTCEEAVLVGQACLLDIAEPAPVEDVVHEGPQHVALAWMTSTLQASASILKRPGDP